MLRDRAAVVRVKALAKINLALHVLGVRPDGYHELRTVFQSLALHDTLTFRAAPGPFRIVCDEAACPTDSTNLVWRAAARVWAAAGRRGAPRDVAVRIVKRIPVQAGLGGGSSDAAATISALTALWRVRVTRQRARQIAVALGADVPFFLEGGTAVGVGRGDVLRPEADAPSASVVLVVPPFGVDTRAAYEWWDLHQRHKGPGRDAQHSHHSHNRGVHEASNDLEAPVVAHHPEIAHLVRALCRHGARHAAMSGSGSAVFGLFDRRADADRAARHLGRSRRRVLVTRTVNRSSYAGFTRPRFL